MISVVIATHNRADRLALTLDALVRLRVPPAMEWEVLVVCNGCNDYSAGCVAPYGSLLPLRCLSEPRRGLSKARNTGLGQARGDIIAFIDDDIIVAPDWLQVLRREFQADYGLHGLGGRVELYDSYDAPMTLQLWPHRTVLTTGRKVSLPHLTLIPGCNMAFSRALIQRIGAFDEALGAGARHPAAEDTDFIYRALCSGARLLFTPEWVVFHNHGRRTPAAMKELMRNYARGRGAFYVKHLLGGDLRPIAIIGQDVWRRAAAACGALVAHSAWVGNLVVGLVAGMVWRGSGQRPAAEATMAGVAADTKLQQMCPCCSPEVEE